MHSSVMISKISRIFLFSVLSSILSVPAFSQDPLPKWMTEEESKIYQNYLDEIPATKQANPPSVPPRTPAEFEEAQGVVIAWASYQSVLREIVRHSRTVATVYIITSNVSSVQNYLNNGGVSLQNVVFVQAPFNSVWIRDYGPQSVYLADTGELAFVDWVYNRPRPDDNQVPQVMANQLSVPFFQMTNSPNRLVATGGNFMSDGFGTGFSSKLILAENGSLSEAQIDNIMLKYKGINRYIKMEELPFDNISHIDMHMKLLNEETLLVGEFPTGVSDGPQIEANLQYVLENYPSVYNRPYKVVRIPMVPSAIGNYPPNAHYRTYTNALILNGIVLVPTYGHQLDNVGLQIFRDAMPGYEIIAMDGEATIAASGSIHCITREIAADDNILFAHASPETIDFNQDLEITASITSHSGITEANLFWRTSELEEFIPSQMTLDGDTFRITLSGLHTAEELQYYFSATNGNDKTVTKPLVAPDGYYRYSNMTVSVNDVAEEMDFTVFPNPTTGNVRFSMTPSPFPSNLVITNTAGQVVLRQTIDPSEYYPELYLDLRGQSPGLYIVSVTSGKSTKVKKLIKH